MDGVYQKPGDVMASLTVLTALMKLAATVQFVHQVNSDAQVDSASQQAPDVMVYLAVQMKVMKLAAFVHQVNSDAQMDSASQQAPDVMVYLVVLMEVMKLAAIVL